MTLCSDLFAVYLTKARACGKLALARTATMFTNHYDQLGNPYFEADCHVWDREVMPSDPDGYLPDDLVALPKPTWDSFPDNQPLSADEARTLVWLFAGNVSKAARYYKMPPERLRAFIAHSSRIAAELYEARERILDRAEQVLHEALFSDDPKRRDSAAKYILTKSATGRSRFHALTDHLQLDPKAARPTIRWAE
jgi:hypothetical protein